MRRGASLARCKLLFFWHHQTLGKLACSLSLGPHIWRCLTTPRTGQPSAGLLILKMLMRKA